MSTSGKSCCLLNTLAWTTAVLILATVGFSFWNQSYAVKVAQSQGSIANGQKAAEILKQLTIRVAQGSDVDPELRKLLIKYDLKASLMVDGKRRDYP